MNVLEILKSDTPLQEAENQGPDVYAIGTPLERKFGTPEARIVDALLAGEDEFVGEEKLVALTGLANAGGVAEEMADEYDWIEYDDDEESYDIDTSSPAVEELRELEAESLKDRYEI